MKIQTTYFYAWKKYGEEMMTELGSSGPESMS